MALTDLVILPGADYQGACDALRSKTGGTAPIRSGELKALIEGIGGTELPELENPGDGSKLLSGYQLIGQDGGVVDGEIVSRTASDLTASGATVTVPAGHYAAQATKSVTTATQATPSITVSASGLITAKATQSAGYVSYGTKQATKQLTTQAGSTVTPTAAEQTVVEAGTYVTGDIKVAAVESGSTGGGDMDILIDKSLTAVESSAAKVGQYAFYGCSKMETASFPEATDILTHAFDMCTTLNTVYAPKVESIASYAFNQCFGMDTVELPALEGAISSNAFYNCSMTRADFGAPTSIASSAFGRCSKMTALILRTDSLVTLSATSAFTSSAIANGTGYVYVPSALVDTYKAATNWSTYAGQIRAIEDYPEITGG